jgi:hypothetical protein
MLWSRFSTIWTNFLRNKWKFSWKPLLWCIFFAQIDVFWVTIANFFVENLSEIITFTPDILKLGVVHMVLPLLIDRRLIDRRLINRQLIDFHKKTIDRPTIDWPTINRPLHWSTLTIDRPTINRPLQLIENRLRKFELNENLNWTKIWIERNSHSHSHKIIFCKL